MNIARVEENVTKIKISNKPDINFIHELLLAYGKPKASITRLISGTYNFSKAPSEVFWKNNVFFKYVEVPDLHYTIDELKNNKNILKHNPRFIIVTDFKRLLAVDTKTEETLDIKLDEITKHYTFFLPWAGMEKSQHKNENLADIKAAEKMAQLYDEIIQQNTSSNPDFHHSLNVFFSRLLFCFFAEDTEVFNKGQFVNSIASYTQVDGSDLAEYLDKLFEALDIESKTEYPSDIQAFPYVNGGLFARKLNAPIFSQKARRLIIECGELNWSQINPDIFGSMIQAVVRRSSEDDTMHYTSVPNILKVIEPSFLEHLNQEFDKYYEDKSKLEKLLQRIYKIKIFDPACGSGNFLIIAYKELRKLEHKIIKRVAELNGGALQLTSESGVLLGNFYGIELDDFAHEIAILSLWLAKHQMNIEFKEMFGVEIPLIPLKETGNVICNNATKIDWAEVCPIQKDDEIYLISNPPYAGSSFQTKEQKLDKDFVFKNINNYKNLDYVACWFKKGANYIRGKNAELSFVSTNSICQGEQVALLWPLLLEHLEIGFAYQSFKWSNNAKGNAGVICIIVNLRNISNKSKYLFNQSVKQNVDVINPYLATGSNVIISKRQQPLSNLPLMSYGSKPVDGGNLILSTPEKAKMLNQYPKTKKYIKKLTGAEEFIYGKDRWCIWITDSDLDEALNIEPIRERINEVFLMRSKSKKRATNKLANKSYKFGEIRYKNTESIIIPSVTSENREYIPIGYLDKNTVVTNRAHVILDAQIYIFGILNSRIHMVWVKAVAGRFKTDYNYSSTIVYNNFPVPQLTEKQKEMITTHAFDVLAARENHSEKTLAQMYDPDIMPKDLKQAHGELDYVVDLCYRSKPFESDEERLSYLFKLYEKMIQKHD